MELASTGMRTTPCLSVSFGYTASASGTNPYDLEMKPARARHRTTSPT
jgi:hypothetical protein